MLLSNAFIILRVLIFLTLIHENQSGTISANLQTTSYYIAPKEPGTSFGPVLLDPDFGRYTLSWEIDWNLETVSFTAVAQTNGFVGFGISRQGTMAGADIVVAEFNADGRIIFQDYHATGHTPPIVDEEQNWTLETYQRNGTHTMIRFSRLFDTQDSDDAVISDEATNFIFAISRSDFPEIVYHGPCDEGFCGIYHVYILGEPSNTEPTTYDTTYETTYDTTYETTYETTPESTLVQSPGTETMSWDTTTTPSPGADIICDFQEILVHPFPAPCYVEFLCYNQPEPILVNNCGFIDFDPRTDVQSFRMEGSLALHEDSIESIDCDFKDIQVHPFPQPCRVEFFCNNFDEIIHVNNCGFIDFEGKV